ncbi:MAG: hypothetical protein IPP47_14145 [Bryobacterales bacterium]|nr:hypothetical protein [Bryobacterales bacterium]
MQVLFFMPIGWSALNALRGVDREPTPRENAIAAVQHCISWATLALFLIAAALSLALFAVRLRTSMKTAQ